MARRALCRTTCSGLTGIMRSAERDVGEKVETSDYYGSGQTWMLPDACKITLAPPAMRPVGTPGFHLLRKPRLLSALWRHE